MNYRIAVRALCEFTAREGDLDLRFTPAPSAQEGMAGHRTVVARRGPDYLSEVALVGSYQGLLVAGRADGYDPALNLLEEIKTHRGDVKRIPHNHRLLHWAQVKVYGWLLCAEYELDEIDLAVVYFNVLSQQETPYRERFGAASLREFFELQCRRFLTWAEQESAHRLARDACLVQLQFPWPSFRTGQRQLANQVYRAARDGHTLMAQATTGIGKTLGTLFPQLKAFPEQQLDRLFFLTAKTPGRQLALDALASLRAQQPEMPLRVLEHVARDKACEYPERACHGDSCPLAKGFYDKLPAAREAALGRRWLTRQAVRDTALAHGVCPYYLSQELCRWTDIVVADYNYYFDMTALLYSLTVVNDWRITLLVDEAHNLIDRGRGMYTAELDQGSFNALRKTAPSALKSTLDRVSRHWNQLHRDQQDDYQIHPTIPDLFVLSLQKAVSAITDHLSDQPEGNDAALLRFYLDAMLFCRLADHHGPHSLFDITRLQLGRRTLSTLCLRNIVPAPFLRDRFTAAHSSTLFSATLSPQHYHADLLGLPADTQWLDVESPFSAEQLQVRFVSNLSTRYQDRARSLLPIAQVMAQQFRERPGNYLAFFSSYAYLQQVLDTFRASWPEIPVREQSRQMNEAQREAFLEEFTDDSRCIGFAVLGGAFGEGIDLPGKRLVGAFIATLGLPQVNPVTEEVKSRMEQMFGQGYDYAYLYPGLQKVVQAAGRVIRTTEDEGVVWLLDDRFGQLAVRQLLPQWWQPERYRLEHQPAPGTSQSLFPG
ncbi:helicase c2 [Pseudomonas saudimassiliensis]|uniref:Helicase c2 n=1 Tax=Pseudomonas saudimassiliensis TaxID=1461581 RepID=A0A078M4J8_9PSED|nr:ATP-dependent DNA helicase [Pseudomonas saudimassiliensis]CEA01215.1 helicase c2 [Pseudomonas saudimassiliensis]CEF25438.1 helicase c2 [Pseudomonas saudimassiliensis]